MRTDTNTLALDRMLVDRREAARMLGVSPGTIDNLRTTGELPSVKIRARRLFDVEDLRRYAQAMKGGDPRVYRPPDPPRNDAAPPASGADVHKVAHSLQSNPPHPTGSSFPHTTTGSPWVAVFWIAPSFATTTTIGPGASADAGVPEGGAA